MSRRPLGANRLRIDLVFVGHDPFERFLFAGKAVNAALVAVMRVRTAAAHDQESQATRARQEADRLGTSDATAYLEEMRRTADVRKNPKAFE